MKRKIIAGGVVLVAALALALGYRAAAAEPTPTLSAVLCPAGADLLVHPDGTWDCGTTPTPAPTGTTATQTPTPAPTTPTPAPTTPSPSPSTTTAPPSPTATPTARLTNCMTRLDACGYPSPTTTGVPASVTLQPYLGPLRISAAGAVIDGKNLPCLEIAASNVTIRNSKITGPCFWGLTVTAGSLRIEDSTIDCVTYQGTGIGSQNLTATRVKIQRCENGGNIDGDNVTIVDSYITDVREVNGGHGDGVQMNHGTNITIKHTTFDLQNPITSSLILGYYTTNMTVEGNFFSAGAYQTYCSRDNVNAVYRNNRYYGPPLGRSYGTGDDPHRASFGYTYNCLDPGITWTGNYVDSTLAAVSAA